MEWPWLLVGLLSLLLLGVSLVLGLRLKKLSSANAELYEALAARIAEAEDPNPNASLEVAAPETTEPPEPQAASATVDPDNAADAESSVSSELAAPAPQEPGSAVEDSGIKTLLRQFTQDSRDMMSRIEALERQAERFAQIVDAAPEAVQAGAQPVIEPAAQAESEEKAEAIAEANAVAGAEADAEADVDAANDAQLGEPAGTAKADAAPAATG